MKIKKNKNKFYKNSDLFLNDDEIYIVYALDFSDNCLSYAVHQNKQTFYPLWYRSELFDIIDNRLSRYWVFNVWGVSENIDKEMYICTFPEWANDPYFYSELIENNWDDPNAVIFNKYLNLMCLEFPDPLITAKAEVGDSNWLICPDCVDAWESRDEIDALVRCPKCRKIYNNPRYNITAKSLS